MDAKQIVSLDVGRAKTGIARASTLARLPEPLYTVPTNDVIKSIEQLASEQPIESIVIGLPRSLSGDETEQTHWVKDWVESAKKQLKAPMYWQDEALTSKEAIQRKPIDEDAAAAAIILRDFLDTPEEQRVTC